MTSIVTVTATAIPEVAATEAVGFAVVQFHAYSAPADPPNTAMVNCARRAPAGSGTVIRRSLVVIAPALRES